MNLLNYAKEIASAGLRKIKCPIHYVLKPGGKPFVLVRNPLLKNFTEGDARVGGFNLWIKKKDRFGRPIPNWSDYYQPEISASFAREKIFTAENPICLKCKRCFTK